MVYLKNITQRNPDADLHFKYISKRPDAFIQWVKASEANYAVCQAMWDMIEVSMLPERYVTAAISHFISCKPQNDGVEHEMLEAISNHLAQIKVGYQSREEFISDFEKTVSKEYSDYIDNPILRKYALSLNPDQFSFTLEKDTEISVLSLELRDLKECNVKKRIVFNNEEVLKVGSILEKLRIDSPDLGIMKEYMIANKIDEEILRLLNS